MHMVKRWLTPQVWQTQISPRILKFRFNMHMVKDDWPPSMTHQERGPHKQLTMEDTATLKIFYLWG